MNECRISSDALRRFVDAMIDDGHRVLAEAADRSGFTPLAKGETVTLDTTRPPTKLSFKDVLLPKTEPLFHYRREDGAFVLVDPPDEAPSTVILGARPCDARSLAILPLVFNWDYPDELFNRRLERTIVIGTACASHDDACFCTSVGGSPTSTEGSDLFLISLPDGAAALRVVSGKGERFVAAYTHLFEPVDPEASLRVEEALSSPPRRFDAAKVRGWIDGHFDDPFWLTAGETCLGCAQCAFSCPVCHCFDIVDEPIGYDGGRRMRNWDACQFGLFTKHASGHNPRETRAKRFRQRVSHKFAYYPSRFGATLCTGCGRCTRGCAVGIDIGAIAAEIGGMAQ